MLWNGISSSVSTSFLVAYFSLTMDPDWNDDQKSKQALLAMEGFAIAEIIGSLISGYI